MTTGTRRLWVVCDVHDPEPSTGFYVARIAEDLATDRDVSVITRRTSGERGEVNGRPAIIGLRPPQRGRPSLVVRAVDGLRFAAAACVHLLRHGRRGDTIVVVSNPPLLPHLVAVAARVRRASLVVLVHDVYPEVLAELGYVDRQGYVMRMLTRAALRLQQRAAVTVVLGRDMQRRLERRRGAEEYRGGEHRGHGEIRIIANWADVEGIRPDSAAGADVRRRWGLSDQFVVLFAGNMGRTHDPDIVLAAAEVLKDDAGVQFVLVGRGARFQQVARSIADRKLANVRLLPACPPGELPAYLNAADVYVIPMRAGTAGLSVPSRLYNAMAAGCPVVAVADSDSELSLVVAETGAGMVVTPGDAAALVAALLQLRDAPEERASMGRAARAAAEAHYTRDHARRAWNELMQSVERRDASEAVAR